MIMTELFSNLPYKVADIALADFGRKEIELAEKECQFNGPACKIRTTKTT